MQHSQPKQSVDACGQSCPMPLLMAKRALRELSSGDMLEVFSTDPGSSRDFQSLQRLAGHGVTTYQCDDGVLRHLIIKA